MSGDGSFGVFAPQDDEGSRQHVILSREDGEGPHDDNAAGTITSISGWVVRARLMQPLVMRELVHVGRDRLIGEVVGLDRDEANVQVYEETSGLAPGEPLYGTGEPLSIELGPGLLGEVFDGVQRPLHALARDEGDFIRRGRRAPALDRERLWTFSPRAKSGDDVEPGSVIGVVQETAALLHPIVVPPGIRGRVASIAPESPRRVNDVIARVECRTTSQVVDLTMFQRWRVRTPRPVVERLPLAGPMITKQRVLDTFFPIARGAAACMPGGFGTGKTVTQHQLCRWTDADVIIFVGCGERGNEITHLVRELPELTDPRNGRRLSERTILIANTSNMPVSAREASLFTGVTIGEYYRDLGFHVVLLADSLSRWAEALREISGRLEEMPAEEGYPPYLSTALAGFFERAGRVKTLSGGEGSLTLIGAISPAAGDLTEPVTRHAQRFVRTFWTLDRQLASARVFPAISVRTSYSDVPPALEQWWSDNVSPSWKALRMEALAFLEEAGRCEETARLVGTDALPEREQFILRMADEFRDGFLQQNAFDPNDASCDPAKQCEMLESYMNKLRSGVSA